MTDSNIALSRRAKRMPRPRPSSQARLAISSLLVPKGQPLQHGKTYLKLLHGRNTPDENLNGWGFAGPTFGPLDWFHITDLQTFRFGRDNVEAEIATIEDLFLWEGKYYGDAEIFRFPDRKGKQRVTPEYGIGVHNDDGDCYDVVIKQNGRPIATLIAPEGEVEPLVHAGNGYATLLSALRVAYAAILEAAGIMLYEGEEPVTFLESTEIERAYFSLAGAIPEIKCAIARCRVEHKSMGQAEGGAHV